MLDDVERRLISTALSESDGSVTEAARRLNTDRPNLYRRMKRLGLMIAMLLWTPFVSGAQTPDSVKADSSFTGKISLDSRRRSSLAISSGKTYNRVEGLPVYIGPTFRDSIGSALVNASVFGIYRSANNFRWDNANLGHRVALDTRWADAANRRGFAIATAMYDVVTPIEDWQLHEPEAGLATLFLHRDYRDYFGRHGGSVAVTAFTWREQARLSLKWGKERWSTREARRVFTIFRNGQDWRPNPVVDDGVFNVTNLTFNLDTRNDESTPWAGWYAHADYEIGSGGFADYGRSFIDFRRYNRISPKTQLNGRFVFGKRIHGDPLPIQRRFSVGGPATIPGFNFNPALEERVVLGQIEYRNELNFHLIDVINSRIVRPRGAWRLVQPVIVAFADAGRAGTSGELMKDVGLGIDLGKIGVYAAKAVSESKEPVNFFVRIRRRF